jgi:hypothetical protein
MHKYTDFRISLKDIKQNLDKQIICNDFKTEKCYRYDFKSIPFSDDFIVKCIDEEFTIGELYELILCAKSQELINKLKDKYNTKRREENYGEEI